VEGVVFLAFALLQNETFTNFFNILVEEQMITILK